MNKNISLKNSYNVLAETYKAIQKSNDPLANVSDLKISWAQKMLSLLKVDLQIIGEPTSADSTLFLGNHISYLDIPLLMSAVPKISFVAKNEIASWPLFGRAAKRIETVFVKREKGDSRKLARVGICDALKSGSRIAIFPSGTTSLTESKTWKRGAFEIAYDQQSWVQPFRINYRPLREVAFIDQDSLLPHMLSLTALEKIEAEIEFHAPTKILDPKFDCLYWNYWARGISLA